MLGRVGRTKYTDEYIKAHQQEFYVRHDALT